MAHRKGHFPPWPTAALNRILKKNVIIVLVAIPLEAPSPDLRISFAKLP